MIFPPNRAENRRIWCIYVGSDCFGRRNLPNQVENLSESWRIRQNLMSLGKSGFTGFEGGDLKPTHMRWVLELWTRVQQLEQSNRVNAGRVQVGWTALISIMVLKPRSSYIKRLSMRSSSSLTTIVSSTSSTQYILHVKG